MYLLGGYVVEYMKIPKPPEFTPEEIAQALDIQIYTAPTKCPACGNDVLITVASGERACRSAACKYAHGIPIP